MKNTYALLILILAALLKGCGGGGAGGTVGSVSANGGSANGPPLAGAGSSYENNLASTTAGFYGLSSISTALGGLEVVAHALVFADFFQEGSFSAAVVAHSPGSSSNSLYFLKKNGTSWTDASNTFIGMNRQVCASVKQLLVADLNKDAKPDIYVVCGGNSPGPQYYFLSHPSNLSYTPYTTSFNITAESASIADVDGGANRTADVITTDNGTATVFLGQIDSLGVLTFTQDNARITNSSPVPNSVQAVTLVPRSQSDGTSRYDLVLGGSGSNGSSAVWLKNSGGYFGAVGRSFVLPNLGSDAAYPYAELRGYIESNGLSYIYAMDHAKSLVRLYSYITPAPTLTDPSPSNTAPGLAYSQAYNTTSTLPSAGWPYQLVKVGKSFFPLDAACEVTGRCNAMFSLP